MQKIMVVEDNRDFQLYLKTILQSPDYSAQFFSNGRDACEAYAKFPFDLILLDLALPDLDGFSVLEKMRESQPGRVPVIFLTANVELNSKLAAYSMGADDYVVKGVDPLEFRSKVEAKLKNLRETAESSRYFKKKHFKLDLACQRAMLIDGGSENNLGLTSLEFKILYYLAKHEGMAFTRDQILTSVWGPDITVCDRTVDTHIYSLRKKLGPLAWMIESIQSVGYLFVGDKTG